MEFKNARDTRRASYRFLVAWIFAFHVTAPLIHVALVLGLVLLVLHFMKEKEQARRILASARTCNVRSECAARKDRPSAPDYPQRLEWLRHSIF
jgi:hypothetical protein